MQTLVPPINLDKDDGKLNAAPENGDGLLRELAAQIRTFFTTTQWLVRGLIRAVGIVRILFIAFQTFLGSVAITLMGFASLVLVRSLVGEGGQGVRGLLVPDLPTWALLLLMLGGGSLGAFFLYDSERRITNAVVAFGDHLRVSLLNDIKLPLSRGWQTEYGRDANRILSQASISGVREISVAAREVFGLVGPTGMFIGTSVVLFAIEPLITAAIVPLGALFLAPMLLINRRMERLNIEFDEAQRETSLELRSSVGELVEAGYSDRMLATIKLAKRSDQITHERLQGPIRMRALGVLSVAFFSIAVLGLFILREGDDVEFLRLIIYLISLRLGSAAASKIAKSSVSVARRSLSVANYQTFIIRLDAFRNRRTVRFEAVDTPTELMILGEEESSLLLRKGSVAIVLTERPPTRATVDEFLILLENQMESAGDIIDLIGNSEVVTAESELSKENYVVTGASSDLRAIQVIINVDIVTASLSSTSRITFVLTSSAAHSLDSELEEWSHLIEGLIVVREGAIQLVCDREWAKENRSEVLRALGRAPKD